MNILIHTDGHTAELYHHGIKGMKWALDVIKIKTVH